MSANTDAPDEAADESGPGAALAALGDPVRRDILAALAEEGESTVGALAERISSVGRTNISMHMRVLRRAGLLTERKEGRYRYYGVDSTGSARDMMLLLQGIFAGSLSAMHSAVAAEGPDEQDAAGSGSDERTA